MVNFPLRPLYFRGKISGKGKGEVLLRIGHEGPEGEQMYSSTLPSTSALDGGGWSTPQPGRFTPGKDPVPTVSETGWAAVPVWKVAENLALTGIRSPDRPASSESLYRLSYPGLPGIHRISGWVGLRKYLC